MSDDNRAKPQNYFMAVVYNRMHKLSNSVQEYGGRNANGDWHQKTRSGNHRIIDLVKWFGKIIGFATTFASLVGPPLMYFMMGVNPLVCFAVAGIGLLVARGFMFLDELLIEAEAAFWLLTSRFRNTTWEEQLASDAGSSD